MGNRLWNHRNTCSLGIVTEGHPDKVCDQISDAILDADYERGPDGPGGLRDCRTTGLVVVLGEITTKNLCRCRGCRAQTIQNHRLYNPNYNFDLPVLRRHRRHQKTIAGYR